MRFNSLTFGACLLSCAALAGSASSDSYAYFAGDEPAQEAQDEFAIDTSVFEVEDGKEAAYYIKAEMDIRVYLTNYMKKRPGHEKIQEAGALANKALMKIYNTFATIDEIDNDSRLKGYQIMGNYYAGRGMIAEIDALLEKALAQKEPFGQGIATLLRSKNAARIRVAAQDDADLQKCADDLLAEALISPQIALDFASIVKQVSEANKEIGEQLKKDAIEKFTASESPVMKRAAVVLAAADRRANLVGSDVKVEGVWLDGTEIDWESYRGKVVLIDFWATWCGPCLAELPNVQAMYEKYHDAGFEVIGYSLDSNVDALKKFEEEKKLPWKTASRELTVNNKEKEMLDLAEYYDVQSIPTMFLIGKDGKGIDADARGQRLQQLLKNLFPEVE